MEMISIEEKNSADEDWNKRLLETKDGTIYQTQEFAEAQKLIGGEPSFLYFTNENEKIVAQLLLISYSRFSKKGNFRKILKNFLGNGGKLFQWVYGPIIFDINFQAEIIKTLQNFIISKKWKIRGSDHPLSQMPLLQLDRPFVKKDWATFLIDLSQDPEEIWKKMDNHSVRKNVRRSKDRGVSIKKMKKKDFLIFLKLLEETGKIHTFSSNKIAEEWWERIEPIGYHGFLAYENSEPIAGMTVSTFNGYVNEFTIVRTQKDYISKLYSQDLLKWHIIDWAINNHFRYYDLTGVTPNSTDKKEIGIYRYKEKWGGDLMKCNKIIS